MKTPKIFISYSWSNPTHERWVLDLGEQLMASGIEVTLDKWDLKPGHDALAFMESMVTDPSIDKVLIICDKIYSAKADDRNGGVGTETQIISKQVYDKIKQDKFIAVIAEKDEAGKAYTPTFYHSRLYIDLSSPDSYHEGFEELIRTIYDQPQHKKPQLGKKPDFLTNEVTISLGTSPQAKRATMLIRDNKSNAGAALEEYLSTFSENLERIRIKPEKSILFDEQVFNSINEFTSTRNELLQVITNAVRYMESQECAERLHKFLESTIKYLDAPNGVNSWSDNDFDNFKFIIHEIFLYTIAICIKHNKFDISTTLLNNHYYITSRRTQPYLAGFECFYKDPGSLNLRNQRLGLNRASLSADISKANNHTSSIDFSLLMQTDFLLFLRCELKAAHWWPKTLVYLGNYSGAFEVFTRSASAHFFEKIKPLLNITGKTELVEFAATAASRGGRYYGFSPWGIDWKRLMNVDELACLA
ncbi:SEFIR domain-containing protein [Pseudomonas sp. zfem002]|uniref:SEFIR domain-containing protein n=1 Tax=Pseudomonas sp. zfem002 TaxID=3078197 RepID=UPI002928D8E8|nr:SEFIR domain-containing protein [Pseudomonas sp. zfem002]MDU9389291.1 TIR domain-containing protein [Pseudomonas sp. zfem002]